MELELACYDRVSDYDSVLNSIFTGTRCTARCVSIPSGLVSRTSFFKEYIDISSAVDFPYGLSETSVRLHEIIVSIRQGASLIDLCINSSSVAEEDWESIRLDIRACLTACKEHNVELRPTIEYRLFSEKTVFILCDLFMREGIEYVANATGTMSDDTMDNVIISNRMQTKTGIKVISCGRIWTPSHS
jgi:deoxyribose-phosphate aldolase